MRDHQLFANVRLGIIFVVAMLRMWLANNVFLRKMIAPCFSRKHVIISSRATKWRVMLAQQVFADRGTTIDITNFFALTEALAGDPDFINLSKYRVQNCLLQFVLTNNSGDILCVKLGTETGNLIYFNFETSATKSRDSITLVSNCLLVDSVFGDDVVDAAATSEEKRNT